MSDHNESNILAPVLWTTLVGVGLAGLGVLAYGALYEANNLSVERQTLSLPGWPESLKGYKVGILADFHVRDKYSLALAKRAIEAALAEDLDMILMTGDCVEFWRDDLEPMMSSLFEPLAEMAHKVIGIPGNHDHKNGRISQTEALYQEAGITLLRNESLIRDGITWVGIDSAKVNQHQPQKALEGVSGPAICLWHEPDMVDQLPAGCHLMLSGHSHGGQFRFPGGYTPMHTKLGEKYPRGFYPDAPTPLYVSRGIGTTGYPSRLNCPPEVSILTLIPA